MSRECEGIELTGSSLSIEDLLGGENNQVQPFSVHLYCFTVQLYVYLN